MTAPALAAEDFDAAKAVYEELKDIPRERQERILRWIAEGFGIVPVPVARATAHAAPPATEQQILPHQSSAVPTAGSDIKTFIAAKMPKSDKNFATAVAYYYRFEAPPSERRDSINGKILQEAARLAGRERFTKPIVTLNNAKKSGLLDAAARGEFAINSVGENLVAMALPAGASDTSSPRGKGRTKRGGRKKRSGQGNKKR